jgi:hypothetical protein
MTPWWGRAALVVHIATSVGWLGAVLASLLLAVVALGSGDADLVRAIYLALEPFGWYALVPLSLASLASGLVQALGTRWGLARHYWVLAKLVMNVFATGILLLYTQTLTVLADDARHAHGDVLVLRTPSPVIHAAAALILLVVALVLSVFKPRGQTGFGTRSDAIS